MSGALNDEAGPPLYGIPDDATDASLSKQEFLKACKTDPERLHRAFESYLSKETSAWSEQQKKSLQEKQTMQQTIIELETEVNNHTDEIPSLTAKEEVYTSTIKLLSHRKTEPRPREEVLERTHIVPQPIPPPAQPLSFKGQQFDGDPHDLARFLRHSQRDFLLYAASFPSDAHKVAYATSGFGKCPEKWVSQFDSQDNSGILESWPLFSEAMNSHFADPDLIPNRTSELLDLKQTNNLMDFVHMFEALATEVNWPTSSWAGTFLHGLRDELATEIRRSEIDIADYSAVKRKAFRLERDPISVQPVRTDLNALDIASPSGTRENEGDKCPKSRRPEVVAKRSKTCSVCDRKGHIAFKCPKKRESAEVKNMEVAMTEKEAEDLIPLSQVSAQGLGDIQGLKSKLVGGRSFPVHTEFVIDNAQVFPHTLLDTRAPDTILSDRGGQFIAEFWREFCKILGINRKLSTAHHPETGGQTGIVNQHIEMRLRPLINHFQDNWSDLVHLIDHAASILPHESTGVSPFLVSCGYEPRMSFDWSEPEIPRPAPRNSWPN